MFMKKTVLVCISLIVLASFTLLADPVVTAQYFPESGITLEVAVGPFTSSTVLGAKLGTFYVESSNGEIYSPSLVCIGEASGAIPLSGLMKGYSTGLFIPGTQDFYIISAAYKDGFPGTPVLQVLYDNVRPLIAWEANTVTVTPFVVELYLVNHNTARTNAVVGYRPASFFSLGTPYSLPINFNPRFSIGVAGSSTTNVGTYTNHDGTVDQDDGSYVTTDSNGGPDNTPIIGPGAYTDPDNPGSPGFFYGDVPVVPSFLFNFLDSQVSFSLESAFPPDKVTVTKAVITVVNGVANDTYDQILSFSDQSGSEEFQLFPVNGSGDPINYRLYLDDEQVEKNDDFLWEDLTPGPNEKDLKIGGIDQSVASSYVSDTYQGTITITISTPD